MAVSVAALVPAVVSVEVRAFSVTRPLLAGRISSSPRDQLTQHAVPSEKCPLTMSADNNNAMLIRKQ